MTSKNGLEHTSHSISQSISIMGFINIFALVGFNILMILSNIVAIQVFVAMSVIVSLNIFLPLDFKKNIKSIESELGDLRKIKSIISQEVIDRELTRIASQLDDVCDKEIAVFDQRSQSGQLDSLDRQAAELSTRLAELKRDFWKFFHAAQRNGFEVRTSFKDYIV